MSDFKIKCLFCGEVYACYHNTMYYLCGNGKTEIMCRNFCVKNRVEVAESSGICPACNSERKEARK